MVEMVGCANGCGPKEPLAMAGFVAGGGMSERAGILRDV